jgi:hypothetical protein
MVLKQELISVQTLMDNMSLEKEKEKDVVEKQYNDFNVTVLISCINKCEAVI